MSSYRLDKGDAARETLRDKAEELASAREYGFYIYHVLEILPLADIHPEAVWNDSRIEHIREGIRAGVPLPPIHVSLNKDGKYHISDGIHRYNASKEAGFTHIPAIVSVYKDVPEMKVQPEEEKPRLPVGSWVILRDPDRGVEPWAMIEEQLPSRTWNGSTRHIYGLVGVRRGKGDFIGDTWDNKFDPAMTHPPANIQKEVEGWYGWPAHRVASTYLRKIRT